LTVARQEAVEDVAADDAELFDEEKDCVANEEEMTFVCENE